MKTKITLLIMLFFGILYSNAQIGKQSILNKENINIKNKPLLQLRKAQSGFQGFVYEESPKGKKLANATIVFTSEDKKLTRKVISDRYGYYKIALPVARYYVTVTHKDYKKYTTGQGFFVVIRGKFNTGNIFLKKVTNGFQGFVYKESSKGKKLANATIVFTSENKKITRRVLSDKSGQYKITLPVARYHVTVTRKGYKKYTTGQGFFVVSKGKFNTGNIFLKKGISIGIPLKESNTIIAVFNEKTKTLVDIVQLNKKNRKRLEKYSDYKLFYGNYIPVKESQIVFNKNKISKGSMISISNGKQYIPGDSFIPRDSFVPGDCFEEINQFQFLNTQFKVLKNTKKMLLIKAI